MFRAVLDGVSPLFFSRSNSVCLGLPPEFNALLPSVSSLPSSSRVHRLRRAFRILPKPTIYSPPVKAMEHEPLLPRLQLLEAVIESVSIPSFDVFQ